MLRLFYRFTTLFGLCGCPFDLSADNHIDYYFVRFRAFLAASFEAAFSGIFRLPLCRAWVLLLPLSICSTLRISLHCFPLFQQGWHCYFIIRSLQIKSMPDLISVFFCWHVRLFNDVMP
jgi:hypothetical protein